MFKNGKEGEIYSFQKSVRKTETSAEESLQKCLAVTFLFSGQ